MLVKRSGVLYGGHTACHVQQTNYTEEILVDLPEEVTMESSARRLPAPGWMPGYWVPAITFVAGCYAVTWLAWAGFHSAAATGKMWAFWAFLLVTVWSPTFIALAITALFDRLSGVGTLLRRLFQLPSWSWSWYLAAIVLPSLCVLVATVLARSLHQGAPLIAVETLIPTMVTQVGTGALGEELGWRGFLLPILQRKASPVTSALIMSVLWSLWHSPSLFFPGLPQVFISPLAFLATVTAFGVFLSLIFNKTKGHVLGTILAHFVLNTSLALGGAHFGNALWWSLAGTFSLLACWSGFMLSQTSGPTAED
jgi:membrane protease YdiL (CAAX protease family)